MKKFRNKSPEEVIRLVTTEIIVRAIKLGKKKNRTIFISKTSGGNGTDVRTLPGTTLSPYFSKVKSGSIIGWNPPNVKELQPDVNESEKSEL